MTLTITEKNENKLLNRTEVKFEASHSGTSTPSRADVLKELAAELKVAEDLIVIDKLNTLHGRQIASGVARAYENADRLAEIEPKFLIERSKPEKKEGEGEAPAEGEKKEEKAEAPKEEKPKEEKKEEKPEEKAEEKPEPPKEEKKE